MPLRGEHKSEPRDFILKWYAVRQLIKTRFDKRPDLNAILFLIGIQETGFAKDNYTKEEKQDLMHVAICHLLTGDGYFQYVGDDAEGWPHYEALQTLPPMHIKKQEDLLKLRIVEYFEDQGLI